MKISLNFIIGILAGISIVTTSTNVGVLSLVGAFGLWFVFREEPTKEYDFKFKARR